MVHVLRVHVSFVASAERILDFPTVRASPDQSDESLVPPPGLYMGWLHTTTRPVLLRVNSPSASGSSPTLDLARFTYWSDDVGGTSARIRSAGGLTESLDSVAKQQRKKEKRKQRNRTFHPHKNAAGGLGPRYVDDLGQCLVVVPFSDPTHGGGLERLPVEVQRAIAATFFETLPGNPQRAWLIAFVRFVLTRQAPSSAPLLPVTSALLESALTSFVVFQ